MPPACAARVPRLVPYVLREYALLYELSTAARRSPLMMPSVGLTLGMPIAGLGAISGLGSSGCPKRNVILKTN